MDSRLLRIWLGVLLWAGLPSPVAAQFSAPPQWSTTNWYRGGATLDLDFVNDRYNLNGTLYPSSGNCTSLTTPCLTTFISGAGATFTRSGTTNVTATLVPFYIDATQGQAFVSRAGAVATYFDNTGTLQTASANTARTNYTYNGSSWVNAGTLIEPAATNQIANNTMVGAVAADGVERATNGTFASCSGASCTGWTTTVSSGTGSVSFGFSTATLTGDGTNAASIYQAITTISGYLYTIEVTTGSGNAVTVQAGTSAGGTQLLSATSAAVSTTSTIQFTATGTTSYVQINNTSVTSATVTTVSVQSAGHAPNDLVFGAQNAGTPGAYGLGLAIKIIGTGTENGISYVDVRYYGTSNGYFITVGQTVVSYLTGSVGQNWTGSFFLKLAAGSFSNVYTPAFLMNEYNSSFAFLGNHTVALAVPTSAALAMQRYSALYIPTGATTAYLNPVLYMPININASIDLTLRIGMPQVEQSSYATSIIATSSAAVTRAADVYSVPSGGTYYNSSGVLKQAPVNTARLDYGSSGGSKPQGILIEQSSTNSVHNNMGVGAVAADGVERVTTGTFTGCSGASCTGWTTTVNGGTGSVSFASNTATLTGDGANAGSIYQAITTVSGGVYTVSVTAGPTGVTAQAGTSAGGTQLLAASSIPASTTTKYNFTATGTTSYVQINNTNASAATVTTVSVQNAGVFPTNLGFASGNGIVPKIIGTGTENGIGYFDVNYSGTVTTNLSNFWLITDTSYPAASSGQVWTGSIYLKLISGTMTGFTSGLSGMLIYERNGGSILASSQTTYIPTSAALSTQRVSLTRTLTNGSTNDITWEYDWQYGAGTVVNWTMRIGMPQLEKGNISTSVVPTYGSAVTRAADVFNIPTSAAGANGAWLTAGSGTMIAKANPNSSSVASINNNLSGFVSLTVGALPANYAAQMFLGGASYSPANLTVEYDNGWVSGGWGNTTNFTWGQPMKGVMTYGSSTVNQAFNGSIVGAPGTVSSVPSFTQLNLGVDRTGGGILNGWLSRFTYIGDREPDAALPDYTR